MERLGSEELRVPGPSSLEHRHRYMCAAAISSGAVLDAACGVGYGARILLSNPDVENYVGIDAESAAIEQALLDPFQNARFLATSAENLPFKEDEFDTVVSFETLEHLNDPTRALAEFRRVLRSDGILIGSVPTATFETFCTTQYGRNRFHLHAFTAEQIRTLLERFFPFVELFIARVSLAAGIYDAAGARGPFHHKVSAEAPTNGSAYGSYMFVASQRRLRSKLAKCLGVLCVGGSYFEAERSQIDRLLATRLMEDLVAQTINNKDEFILQRGAEIERLEAIVNCKAEDALKQDEEIGRLRAMFNAQNQRALKQDEEIDRLQRLLDTKSEDVLRQGKEIDRLQFESNEKDQRVKRRDREANALVAAKNARLKVAEAQLKIAEAELSQTRTQLGAIREELRATGTELGAIREELRATETLLDETRRELDATRQELQATRPLLDEARNELGRIKVKGTWGGLFGSARIHGRV